ncbi:hypothetical protein GCM10023336_42220 [Streptomyces similanensis]|uniref:Uncharacterized protein n=2 Tax=Streptomyces TaxID=1883 RepID=A0ABP9KPU8_9ACTN
MRMRKTAAGSLVLAALLLGGAGAQSAQAADYRIPGGRYDTYVACRTAGSLSVGMGLFSRFECVDNGNGAFDLFYVS